MKGDEASSCILDPLILVDSSTGEKYYGGNQDWYSSNTKAYAGCGSVACANVLRILACKYPKLFNSDDVSSKLSKLIGNDIEKSWFLEFMGSIYKTMFVFEVPVIRRLYDHNKRGCKPLKILPPSFGMSISGFIRGVLRYAQRNGILLHAHALPTAFCKYDSGLAFIKKGLEKSGAVVILTSLNRHPLMLYSGKSGSLEGGYDYKYGMKSHFATITGIEETDGEILVKLSTWGRVATVPYRVLNKSWRSPKAFTSCLYYFTPAKSEKIVKKDIRRSVFVYMKSVFLGGFGWIFRR